MFAVLPSHLEKKGKKERNKETKYRKKKKRFERKGRITEFWILPEPVAGPAWGLSHLLALLSLLRRTLLTTSLTSPPVCLSWGLLCHWCSFWSLSLPKQSTSVVGGHPLLAWLTWFPAVAERTNIINLAGPLAADTYIWHLMINHISICPQRQNVSGS